MPLRLGLVAPFFLFWMAAQLPTVQVHFPSPALPVRKVIALSIAEEKMRRYNDSILSLVNEAIEARRGVEETSSAWNQLVHIDDHLVAKAQLVALERGKVVHAQKIHENRDGDGAAHPSRIGEAVEQLAPAKDDEASAKDDKDEAYRFGLAGRCLLDRNKVKEAAAEFAKEMRVREVSADKAALRLEEAGDARRGEEIVTQAHQALIAAEEAVAQMEHYTSLDPAYIVAMATTLSNGAAACVRDTSFEEAASYFARAAACSLEVGDNISASGLFAEAARARFAALENDEDVIRKKLARITSSRLKSESVIDESQVRSKLENDLAAVRQRIGDAREKIAVAEKANMAIRASKWEKDVNCDGRNSQSFMRAMATVYTSGAEINALMGRYAQAGYDFSQAGKCHIKTRDEPAASESWRSAAAAYEKANDKRRAAACMRLVNEDAEAARLHEEDAEAFELDGDEEKAAEHYLKAADALEKAGEQDAADKIRKSWTIYGRRRILTSQAKTMKIFKETKAEQHVDSTLWEGVREAMEAKCTPEEESINVAQIRKLISNRIRAREKTGVATDAGSVVFATMQQHKTSVKFPCQFTRRELARYARSQSEKEKSDHKWKFGNENGDAVPPAEEEGKSVVYPTSTAVTIVSPSPNATSPTHSGEQARSIKFVEAGRAQMAAKLKRAEKRRDARREALFGGCTSPSVGDLKSKLYAGGH